MNQKTTLAIAVAIVGGVTIAVANPWNPKMDPMPIFASQKGKIINQKSRADMETRTSSLNMEASGVKHIKVDVELGEVEVSTNSSSAFAAQITKGVSRPISDFERQWLDNPWLKVRREGDTLVVYEDKSLKPDFNKRNRNGKQNNQIDCTIKIQIPRGLSADLTLMAGNQLIQGDFRSLTTHVMAGELTLDRVDSGDFLKAEVEAGEVNAKLARVPSRESSIKVSVGEINLDVQGNATVFAKSSIGSISASGKSDEDQDGLGSNQQIRLGTGGTKFSLNVGAGSINVGNGIIEKRSKRDKKDNLELDLDEDTNFRIDLKDDEDFQREITEALRAAKSELRSLDIEKEVAKALKEARMQLDSVDIEAEVSRAMKESKVDVESALKDADREIAKAMREIEIDMRDAEDSEGRYRTLSRDALRMAKQILEQTRATMKHSFSHMKSVPHKPAKKKNGNE